MLNDIRIKCTRSRPHVREFSQQRYQNPRFERVWSDLIGQQLGCAAHRASWLIYKVRSTGAGMH